MCLGNYEYPELYKSRVSVWSCITVEIYIKPHRTKIGRNRTEILITGYDDFGLISLLRGLGYFERAYHFLLPKVVIGSLTSARVRMTRVLDNLPEN